MLGFHFTDPKTFLYTSGTPLLKKHVLGGGTSVAFTSPAGHKYCDVQTR